MTTTTTLKPPIHSTCRKSDTTPATILVYIPSPQHLPHLPRTLSPTPTNHTPPRIDNSTSLFNRSEYTDPAGNYFCAPVTPLRICSNTGTGGTNDTLFTRNRPAVKFYVCLMRERRGEKIIEPNARSRVKNLDSHPLLQPVSLAKKYFNYCFFGKM
jgi:hypothetical protein